MKRCSNFHVSFITYHIFRSVRRLSVIADRLDRAALKSINAHRQFLIGLRLFFYKRVAVLIVTGEIIGRGLAAHVAIDAVAVNIKFALLVIGQSFINIRHFRKS